jgi:hypothetical protein
MPPGIGFKAKEFILGKWVKRRLVIEPAALFDYSKNKEAIRQTTVSLFYFLIR